MASKNRIASLKREVAKYRSNGSMTPMSLSQLDFMFAGGSSQMRLRRGLDDAIFNPDASCDHRLDNPCRVSARDSFRCCRGRIGAERCRALKEMRSNRKVKFGARGHGAALAVSVRIRRRSGQKPFDRVTPNRRWAIRVILAIPEGEKFTKELTSQQGACGSVRGDVSDAAQSATIIRPRKQNTLDAGV